MSQINQFYTADAFIKSLIGDAGASVHADMTGEIYIEGGTGITTTGTPGANKITIDVAASVPTTFATDLGSATPALNTITFTGGSNINTSGAGAAVTINVDTDPVFGIVSGTTFDTNVPAAGLELTATTLSADGTDANIDINITPKGTGVLATTELTLTTDLAVTHGGTGASTLTDHGVLVGSGTGAITALGVGTTGQVLQGSTGADPVWSTATYPSTVAIGDVLVASAANTVDVVTGAATATYVLTANGAGTAPTFQANPQGTVTSVSGGVNLSTSGTATDPIIDMDSDLSSMDSITFDTGGSIQTNTTATNTLLIQAYDVDGTTYVPFITLTANDTPTCDLNTDVTIGTKYIYRADGTDVPVADGGTGVSTLTDHGILLGSGAGAVTVTAEPSNGQLLIGNTGNDPSLSTLTAGAGINIANAAGSITITASGGGIAWTEVVGTTQSMAVNNGYILNNVALVTATLPATASVGDVLEIVGKGAGGWLIAQNAGQTIHFISSDTTPGVGGSLASTNRYDSVEIVCITADTDFVVKASVGNITVV